MSADSADAPGTLLPGLDGAALAQLLMLPDNSLRGAIAEPVAGSSCVWRIRLCAAEPGPGVPRSVIAKLPPAHEGVRAFKERLGLSRTERGVHGPGGVTGTALVQVPRLLGSLAPSSAKTASLLLLEDLSEGALLVQGTLPKAATERAVRAIASLHGRWWGRVPGEWRWLRPENSAERAEFLITAFQGPGLDAIARCDWLPAPVREASTQLASRAPELLDSLCADPVTVVHGDLHAANILIPADPGDPGIRLIDWEAASRARGALDLAFLLMNSEADDLTALLWYLAEIQQAIPGYSRDELYQDYRRGLAYYYLRRIALRAAYAGVPDDAAMRRVVSALLRHRCLDLLNSTYESGS